MSAAEWIVLELELRNMEYEVLFTTEIAMQKGKKKWEKMVCMTTKPFEAEEGELS